MIILILIFSLIVFNYFRIYYFGKKDWNNGTCSKCGSNWKLNRVNIHGRYYCCPKCGKEIIITPVDIDNYEPKSEEIYDSSR